MAKDKGQKIETKSLSIKDEPGADDRFLRGVRKALNTPPTKHDAQPKIRGKGTTKKD